jgi:hypothetical protein
MSRPQTLRLRLPSGMTPDDAIELLGAAGCTEALVGAGEAGVLALMFEGPVALSTLANVAGCIPEAVVLSFSSNNEVLP